MRCLARGGACHHRHRRGPVGEAGADRDSGDAAHPDQRLQAADLGAVQVGDVGRDRADLGDHGQGGREPEQGEKEGAGGGRADRLAQGRAPGLGPVLRSVPERQRRIERGPPVRGQLQAADPGVVGAGLAAREPAPLEWLHRGRKAALFKPEGIGERLHRPAVACGKHGEDGELAVVDPGRAQRLVVEAAQLARGAPQVEGEALVADGALAVHAVHVWISMLHVRSPGVGPEADGRTLAGWCLHSAPPRPVSG